MNPTKTVATIGPASCSETVLEQMIDAGLDVVRLNFSHGVQSEHGQVVERVRRLAGRMGRHVALMGDLCGPKIRVAQMPPEGVELHAGDTCRIVRQAIIGDRTRFGTNTPAIVDAGRPGHRVLVDDGRVRLEISDCEPDALVCLCRDGGVVTTGKGIVMPDSDPKLSNPTDKDLDDLNWAISQELDFVAVSFVRSADDVLSVRRRLDEAGSSAWVVSKIETPQALDNIDDIIEASDAVLVARGDLGVTTDLTRVPIVQKDLVRRCRSSARPVIVATEMLQTMIEEPSPTRAEVSDVANAVFDGADAVMLSAETAIGHYPVEALAFMNRITEQVAAFQAGQSRMDGPRQPEERVGVRIDRTTAAVARSVANVAEDLQAAWIAVWCRTGTTARWIGKYELAAAIVGLSDDPAICRRLALCRGVVPFLVSRAQDDVGQMLDTIHEVLASQIGGGPMADGDERIVLMVGRAHGTRREPILSIHVLPR